MLWLKDLLPLLMFLNIPSIFALIILIAKLLFINLFQAPGFFAAKDSNWEALVKNVCKFIAAFGLLGLTRFSLFTKLDKGFATSYWLSTPATWEKYFLFQFLSFVFLTI